MGMFTNDRAKAAKQLAVMSVPNIVGEANTTPLFVGKGNLCRIEGTAGGYIRFAPEGDSTVPTNSTPETIKTSVAFFYVISTNDYIIASAAMRVEVTKD